MQTIIVGKGRIGMAIAGMAISPIVISRADPIPDIPGPIIVCTRNDDLDAVLAKTPRSKRQDLVFVQNGMIYSWLEKHDLQNNTQALLYFAVSSIGAVPVDGGKTVVCGKWAKHFQQLLQEGSIQCRIVDIVSYQLTSIEKFLWICVFGLLCQRYQCTVSEVVMDHHSDIDRLTHELANFVYTLFGLQRPLSLIDDLCSYSMTIPDYKGAVKEWSWRNGWLVAKKKTPVHMKFLQEVGR